jgi:hypothetical protein
MTGPSAPSPHAGRPVHPRRLAEEAVMIRALAVLVADGGRP